MVNGEKMSNEALTVISWLIEEARKARVNAIELAKMMMADMITEPEKLILDLIWANVCIRAGGKEIPEMYMTDARSKIHTMKDEATEKPATEDVPSNVIDDEILEVKPVKKVKAAKHNWTDAEVTFVATERLKGKSVPEIANSLGVNTMVVYTKLKALKKS